MYAGHRKELSRDHPTRRLIIAWQERPWVACTCALGLAGFTVDTYEDVVGTFVRALAYHHWRWTWTYVPYGCAYCPSSESRNALLLGHSVRTPFPCESSGQVHRRYRYSASSVSAAPRVFALLTSFASQQLLVQTFAPSRFDLLKANVGCNWQHLRLLASHNQRARLQQVPP